MTNGHNPRFSFLKALVKDPAAIGAITPSSHFLGEEMAAHIYYQPGAAIVELGAGTGVITEALLAAGVRPEDLIVIEYSHTFATQLRAHLPHVRIIEGDAANLTTLLRDLPHPIHSIISSLPLRTLPKLKTEAILQQVVHALAPGGRYIQFTYSLKSSQYPALMHYRRIFSKIIWRNLPPARVDVWEA
ncbi:MAG TPA: methyltransferase domain-containing protein [Gammaproteobacteria bacterium]|nr:methyltransferase domain-containing protein [Gammaproteobacteria bacterium]